MTGGKRLRIAALFVIVLVFAFIMDMSSNAITDNTLIRNDTGDGDAVYDLVLNADGLDEDYSYQLKVMEEQPSDKQANELFTQAKKEIDDSFCEENQSVEQVRGHVIMKDAYASGAVEAEWTLSDYDVVDINGDVNQDAFEEADDEQGKLIVPAKDVEDASKELFGSTFHLSSKHPQNDSFFVYDESSDTYRVLPRSSVTSTVPQIKEVKKENGSIVVTVEFSSTAQGAAVETYRYILEIDSLSGEPYLSSIQSA